MIRASRRAKARKARRKQEVIKELSDHGREQRRRPYDHLADPAWNRDVVHGMAGLPEANYWVEEEDDDWLSLQRYDRRCMWYHPGTRRAYWTGFEPLTEFFIRDIEQYITQKFLTP